MHAFSAVPSPLAICAEENAVPQPRGAEQKAQAFPDRRVVINYSDQRVVLIYGFTLSHETRGSPP
jgi:hypothetical protein